MAWTSPSTFADLGDVRDPAFLNEMRDNLAALGAVRGDGQIFIPAWKFQVVSGTATLAVVGSAGAQTRAPAYICTDGAGAEFNTFHRMRGQPPNYNFDILWAPSSTNTGTARFDAAIFGLQLGDEIDGAGQFSTDTNTLSFAAPGVVDALQFRRPTWDTAVNPTPDSAVFAYDWLRISWVPTWLTYTGLVHFFGVLIGAE